MTRDFPPIEELLPHRGSMLLLDGVLSFDMQTVVAEYTPRHDAWYADTRGDMPAWIGLELMAQAVAAHVALKKRANNLPPRIGVLLGTRRYSSELDLFTAGNPLQIRARNEFFDESGLGAYQCEIQRHEKTLASALLKVYEPENPQQLLRMQERNP
jgi:predicted hotdog family 3-hydroxylacyl-ACP dehydratase